MFPNRCMICQKITDDLYECDECNSLVCEDHIIDQSFDLDDIKIICTNCFDKDIK